MTYVIPERVLRLAKEGGWIGVDLDGTTLTYYDWVKWNVFGEPIGPMIERIKAWIAAGVEVRIVTARIGLPLHREHHVGGSVEIAMRLSDFAHHICQVTGERFSDLMMANAIGDYLVKQGIPRLQVQCYKDYNMIELWDDRAIQVVANTGRTLAEEHEAELAALRGKQFAGSSHPGF